MSSNYWVRCFLMPLMMASMLLITGCGGCRDEENPDKKTAAEKREEAAKRKKEKPKEDFVWSAPITYPGIFKVKPGEQIVEDDRDRDEPKTEIELEEERRQRRIRESSNQTKAGHWVNVLWPAIANNFDANGNFVTTPVSVGGDPIRLQGTDFYMYSQRPASLPKGAWKNLETSVYFPKRDSSYATSTMSYEVSGSAGLPKMSTQRQHMLMKPFQNHMVVLSNRPDAYRYLNALDCVKIPNLTSFDSPLSDIPYFQIVLPDCREYVPLPRNPLMWTTTAYLVWDDVSPITLDEDQQNALLDWLAFGGQLILSGPDCLDGLRGSFLEPYLPAKYVESANLSDEDFAEMNENWSLKMRKDEGKQRLLRVGATSTLGVKWELASGAQFIDGTGENVAERFVGRGRVVATRFSINVKSPVIKWQSYPSFFNACLLRRPGREFSLDSVGQITFGWDGDSTHVFDPMLNSTLRYLSRDLKPLTPDMFQFERKQKNSIAPGQLVGPDSFVEPDDLNLIRSQSMRRRAEDKWHYGGFEYDNQAGVAGWNDYSGISNAARKSLKAAAGIDPPSAIFVLQMLSIYLLVLVPVNWILFRLIGKVEWAWIAAPVIAIAGAFTVVKMASLDIGFAQSQTQVGLLELHGDYPRGHLTEYSAMYTSLSKRYAMTLDEFNALSLPFSVNSRHVRPDTDRQVRGVQISRTGVDKRLENFLIQSNSTGMLHSEMVCDTKGTISMESSDSVLNNQSIIDLSSVGVVRRGANDQYQVAWVGDLSAGATARLKFEDVERDQLYSKWFETKQFRVTLAESELLWSDNFGRLEKISLLDLQGVEGVNQDKMMQVIMELDPSIGDSPPNEKVISRKQFELAFEKAHDENSSELNLGGMLFSVDRSLELAEGECRLVGYTQQKLSQNDLEPVATQIQRMTMVLVHLKRPTPLAPKPDNNSWLDFILESDLDFQLDAEEFDSEFQSDSDEDE